MAADTTNDIAPELAGASKAQLDPKVKEICEQINLKLSENHVQVDQAQQAQLEKITGDLWTQVEFHEVAPYSAASIIAANLPEAASMAAKRHEVKSMQSNGKEIHPADYNMARMTAPTMEAALQEEFYANQKLYLKDKQEAARRGGSEVVIDNLSDGEFALVYMSNALGAALINEPGLLMVENVHKAIEDYRDEKGDPMDDNYKALVLKTIKAMYSPSLIAHLRESFPDTNWDEEIKKFDPPTEEIGAEDKLKEMAQAGETIEAAETVEPVVKVVEATTPVDYSEVNRKLAQWKEDVKESMEITADKKYRHDEKLERSYKAVLPSIILQLSGITDQSANALRESNLPFELVDLTGNFYYAYDMQSQLDELRQMQEKKRRFQTTLDEDNRLAAFAQLVGVDTEKVDLSEYLSKDNVDIIFGNLFNNLIKNNEEPKNKIRATHYLKVAVLGRVNPLNKEQPSLDQIRALANEYGVQDQINAYIHELNLDQPSQ